MKTRALVYIRKSSVRNRRDEISPERQLANCLAAAESHGWAVSDDDVYRDAEGHRSGRTEDHRPAWQALKARVAGDPSVAAVVVNSLDRGSRSPKDFFNFLDLVKRREVEIVSVTEQFDTSTAIGRAFLAILMVIASLESDLASERTTSTIDYLKSQGLHWGITPYGYSRDENSVPQPDENAEVVVEALTHYAEGGRSYAAVARHLSSLGHRWRNRGGEAVPFNKYAVRSIVSNVLIYAGWVPQGRGKDMQINDDARTLRELVLITDAVPGQHPPLVDEQLVNEVLDARHKRLDLAVRRIDYIYLLTPIAYCADCGLQLRGKAGRRANTGPRYAHYNGACPSGPAGSHEAEVLEAEVLKILDLHLSEEVIVDLRKIIKERVQSRPENAGVRAQIGGLQQHLGRQRELYVLGDYDRDEYMAVRAEKMAEIAELERELGGADYPLEAALARVNRMGEMLRDGTRNQQKRAINLMLDKILVGTDSKIKGVKLQDWAQPLFADLLMVSGDTVCPQGNTL
jgi:site-specific DNA recombinase